MEESQSKEAGKAKPKASPKASPKATPIQIAAITLSSVAIVGMGIMFLTRDDTKAVKPNPESTAALRIGMEANIITNEEDAANMKQNEPFDFTTWHQREIYIRNGKDATCSIGNDVSNYYDDMYIQIYLNDANGQPAEEIYVSKIIPRGSHIESFTATRDIEPGTYQGTLIYSCVNEAGELMGDTPFVVDIYVES